MVISEPSFFPSPVCTLLGGNFILSQVPTALLFRMVLPTQSQLQDDILTVWQLFQKGPDPSKLQQMSQGELSLDQLELQAHPWTNHRGQTSEIG